LHQHNTSVTLGSFIFRL